MRVEVGVRGTEIGQIIGPKSKALQQKYTAKVENPKIPRPNLIKSAGSRPARTPRREKEDEMSWKTLVIAAVTLGCGSSVMAQDKQSELFLGIWEINLTKTVNYPQQSQMIINVPAPGGGFISTRATIAKENKSSSSEIHPVAFDGKPHATTGGDVREITYKLIDPYTIERTHNRNGRITVDTEQVSKDGKTLTVTQPGGVTRIYDKKFSVKAD